MSGQLARCSYGFDDSVDGRLQRQADIACDLHPDLYGMLAAISDAAKMGISMRRFLGIRWQYPVTRKAAVTLMWLYDLYGEIPGTLAQREGMNAYVVKNLRSGTIKSLLKQQMIILDGGWYRLCDQEINKLLKDFQGLNEFSGGERIFRPDTLH